MLGSALLKEKAQPTPNLRLVQMAKAQHMGEVHWEAPSEGMSLHPQSMPYANVFSVSGAQELNGTYVVITLASDDLKKREFFITEAKKMTEPLPKKKGPNPIFGLDELSLRSEQTVETTNLSSKPEVKQALTKCIKAAYPDTNLNIA